MKKSDLAKKIMETNGKIFRVTFEKKDGSIRTMVARTGVSKGVTGEGRKFDPAEKGLVGVYEMLAENGKFRAGQFRMFAIDRLLSAKVAGEEIEAE